MVRRCAQYTVWRCVADSWTDIAAGHDLPRWQHPDGRRRQRLPARPRRLRHSRRRRLAQRAHQDRHSCRPASQCGHLLGRVDEHGHQSVAGEYAGKVYNTNPDGSPNFASVAFGGRSLTSLMLDRTINPGHMSIVREILDGTVAYSAKTSTRPSRRATPMTMVPGPKTGRKPVMVRHLQRRRYPDRQLQWQQPAPLQSGIATTDDTITRAVNLRGQNDSHSFRSTGTK